MEFVDTQERDHRLMLPKSRSTHMMGSNDRLRTQVFIKDPCLWWFPASHRSSRLDMSRSRHDPRHQYRCLQDTLSVQTIPLERSIPAKQYLHCGSL